MYRKGEDRSTTDKTIKPSIGTETAYGWNGGGTQRTHPPNPSMSYLGIADKGLKLNLADQVDPSRPGTDAGETAWDETLARHVWGKTTRTDDKGRLE